MSYNPQNPNGQATSANSAPVVIASDQSAVPVSGTVTTTPSGTQTVSGTVTANAGTNLNTSALALDATLTGGTQKSKLVDTGGTNVASISAAGALKVDGSAVTQPVSGTVTITPSGTQTVSGTVTASNVSGDVASGSADSGNPVKVGAKFNSTRPTFTDGQRGDMQIDARGNLSIAIASTGGTTQADVIGTSADTKSGANALSVGGYGMVYNGSTWDRMRAGPTTGSVLISPPTATAAAVPANAFFVGGKDTSGNLQGLSTLNANGDATGGGAILGTGGWVYNGSTWDRARGTTSGAYNIIRDAAGNARGANVNASSQLSVSVDGVGTAATSLGKAEDAAHTSGDTGVFMLAVRNDAMAAQTNTDLDYSPISVSSTGRVLVTPAPSAAMLRGFNSVAGTGSTAVTGTISGDASLKTYITDVQVANTGSSTTLITLQDGSGGTTLAYTIAPAGGGSNIHYEIPLVTTANTALFFACGTSSTTVYVSAQGYKAP